MNDVDHIFRAENVNDLKIVAIACLSAHSVFPLALTLGVRR